jgi:hypothetical protein
MMKKAIVIALAVACVVCVAFVAHAGENAQPRQGKTIVFEGGSCEFHSLNKKSAIMSGFEAFDLYLKYSLKEGTDADSLKVLKKDGEFVAPDGKRYKAMLDATAKLSAKSGAEADTPLYILVVPTPKGVDVETLKFVYKNQELSLKK